MDIMQTAVCFGFGKVWGSFEHTGERDVSGAPPPHGLPPGPLPPGFPPGFAFPRPGGLPGAPPGLPPLLFGAGGPGGPQIPPQIPREYPLYPWFISRRFPGGKCVQLLLLYFDPDFIGKRWGAGWDVVRN